MVPISNYLEARALLASLCGSEESFEVEFLRDPSRITPESPSVHTTPQRASTPGQSPAASSSPPKTGIETRESDPESVLRSTDTERMKVKPSSAADEESEDDLTHLFGKMSQQPEEPESRRDTEDDELPNPRNHPSVDRVVSGDQRQTAVAVTADDAGGGDFDFQPESESESEVGDSDPEPATPSPLDVFLEKHSFTVELKGSLGINIQHQSPSTDTGIVVLGVRKSGSAADWNKKHKKQKEQQLRKGDVVLGISGSPVPDLDYATAKSLLLMKSKSGQSFELQMLRSKDWKAYCKAKKEAEAEIVVPPSKPKSKSKQQTTPSVKASPAKSSSSGEASTAAPQKTPDQQPETGEFPAEVNPHLIPE